MVDKVRINPCHDCLPNTGGKTCPHELALAMLANLERAVDLDEDIDGEVVL